MTDHPHLGEMPRALRVKSVKTGELKPNPHNPRMLFDREPLKTLEDSIRSVGILVPLTVYRAKGSNHYTILDGQRRWMCAEKIGLPTVPINEVAEPTTAQNIVTMFQIHKLREDWELMPSALKLEVLMKELDERGDKALSVLTGLDVAVITRCKKLLWYPKRYQQTMLFVDPTKRMKADFFIELYPVVNDRNVRTAQWYHRDQFIDRMIDKFENKKSGLKAVTDFRILKQHLTNAAKVHKTATVLVRLRAFINDDSLTLDHLEVDNAGIHKQATKLTRQLDKLIDQVSAIDAKEFYGEEEFWRRLEKMVELIRRKLREADRRLAN